MFSTRIVAGRRLAQELQEYAGTNAIVLGIPRGGVPIAYTVAAALHLPFDIVLTKKIGHPMNREYAIGAVGLEDSYIIPHDDVSDAYIQEATEKVRARLREMQQAYKGQAPMANIAGKVVLLIDDGIATGNTLLVTVRMLRKSHPAKIVVATPVSSRQACDKLSQEADACLCLHIPPLFTGVGAYYEDFSEVTDAEVERYMQLAGAA